MSTLLDFQIIEIIPSDDNLFQTNLHLQPLISREMKESRILKI